VLRVKAKGQGEPEGGRSPCERERGRSGLQVLCPMNRGSLGPRDECALPGAKRERKKEHRNSCTESARSLIR
jgi:hypothetical protein